MHRLTAALACSVTAFTQPGLQPDPINAVIQALWQAQTNGRLAEAAAYRDQALALLQRTTPDSAGFAGSAQQISALYQGSGLNRQARAVLQQALERAATLGETHPANISLSSAIGEAWRRDGNLLKAVAYLERAAAAQAVAPPAQPQTPGLRTAIFLRRQPFFQSSIGAGHFDYVTSLYLRVAELYQQLGPPGQAAATISKIRTRPGGNPVALARFYEQQQQPDEAAAIYQKMAETSADPLSAASAWQALADLDAGRQRFTDALDAMRKAITAVDSSSSPDARWQTLWMRASLASYMRSADQGDEANQLYRRILEESRNQPAEGQALSMYAQYLAESGRGPEGENLLKEYLATHSSAEPAERGNMYFQLAVVARRAGHHDAANQYQQAGDALQRKPAPPTDAGRLLIADQLQKAQEAANEHRLDDAFRQAVAAIENAPQAAGGQQAGWRIPQIAQALASGREEAKAEQLFLRLIDSLKASSAYNPQALLLASQNYTRFLMSRPDRAAQVAAAIESYRGLLADANGSDSGTLTEPLRMQLEYAGAYSEQSAADALARDILEFQESLSGNTSEPYFGDLVAAARMYQSAGDYTHAVPLLRRAVSVADLLAGPNSGSRRAQARTEAAMALAHQGQFDEAEALAAEAIDQQIGSSTPGPQFTQQLEQIHRMKQAAAARSNR